MFFFHEPVSPARLRMPLGPFQIFMTIRGHIRSFFVILAGMNDICD
jgi:hypothetical protein